MNTDSVLTTPEQQRALERFYFHEARLLDSRQYMQWLGLLSQDIRYLMPSRVNVQVDNRQRGNEDMISIERELEGEDSMGCPHREEGYILHPTGEKMPFHPKKILCQDNDPRCPKFASWESDECNKNPAYMHKYCKKSCGICSDTLSEEL